MEWFADWFRYIAAIGGLATIAAVGRMTWRGIWHLLMAEYRALNCEKREAALELHAEKILRALENGERSGTWSRDIRIDS